MIWDLPFENGENAIMKDSLIGRFVTSKAGHDKNQIYVIVAEDGDFVDLCDGRLKTINKPKRKRKKHIQLTNHTVKQDLLFRLCSKERVLDEEIKYEIKHYNMEEIYV